jgi:hypothetical protein
MHTSFRKPATHMAAVRDSPELRTLKECTPELETALRGLERGLVQFLDGKGFFIDGAAERILNPVTLLPLDERVGELVTCIKHRVGQYPPSYHVLLDRLKEGGKYYEPIVGILEVEFTKQTQPSKPGS